MIAPVVQGGGDQRAGRPGGLERAQVVVIAHPAARIDGEPGKGRRELGDGAQRRPRAAAHADEINHQELADPERGRQRRGGGRFATGELGTRGDQSSVPEVDAEDQRRYRARGYAGLGRIVGTQRLGTDHVAGDTGAGQCRRPPGSGGAGVHPRLRHPGHRGQRRRVHGRPGERVQIGDVQAAGPADAAQRVGDAHGLAAIDQRAAQRRVVGALPAPGMDDDAALEVEDRNDAHRLGPQSTH